MSRSLLVEFTRLLPVCAFAMALVRAPSSDGAVGAVFEPETPQLVSFAPLAGPGANDAFCFVLVIGETRFLLDCGWTESFNEADVSALEVIADSVDVVLLSHATVPHLGGLPYLLGRLGCKAQVYATLPVHRIGQLTMLDALESCKRANPEFRLFTPAHIEEAFHLASFGGRFHQLRCVGVGVGV